MTDQPKIMKVKVVLSVEVDVEDYRLNYGDATLEEIRRDVRDVFASEGSPYLANGIKSVRVQN